MQVECELYVVSGVECTASQQESALKDAQSIQRRNYNACQCLSVKTNAWAMGVKLSSLDLQFSKGGHIGFEFRSYMHI